ncbi:DNA primase-helicase subunit [Aeromonas phage phiAS5]|uniref:DnaB-like replicative helicase n=1 Tax=Aeromonas phage phiAS5 TaxID=879630 RepID=E1A2N8_9CAUD|nr:DNA primase-helicase subunit [Aeromonas phage phiAS5]ADM79984.1 DNA primase-helicase subunit [Aeromonas phage phiAS5]
MSIEQSILTNLLVSEEYFRQVFPFIKREYFPRGPIRLIFELIQKHYTEYKTIPTHNALAIALEKRTGISQVEFDEAYSGIGELVGVPEDLGWLLAETEKYCQERAMHNALSEAILIQENHAKPLDERDRKIKDIGAIPDLMKNALAVAFNLAIGHDYFDDVESRFQSYKTKSKKIPFITKILNTITKGGVERRTLNIILAGVNVGKSLGLCHLACEYLLQGYNVLYVSMEMGEEVCGKRIDANLLDVTLDDIDDGLISETDFMRRFAGLKQKNCGKLVVKQFPTGAANCNHLDNLMSDLQIKKGFKPDIVIVDYLGIMASKRMTAYSENSYTMVKAIAEELRGFAIEHDVVVWSAAQTTRGGWDSSDINMSDVAESAGLPATCDFMLAAMETEELAEINQQLFKQIKSRYGDKNKFTRFNLCVNKGKQRWTEPEGNFGGNLNDASSRMNEAHKENVAKAKDLSTRNKMDKLADATIDDAVDWGI